MAVENILAIAADGFHGRIARFLVGGQLDVAFDGDGVIAGGVDGKGDGFVGRPLDKIIRLLAGEESLRGGAGESFVHDDVALGFPGGLAIRRKWLERQLP